MGGLTMPAAYVSLAIAERAVEGTKRLSDRVIGAEPEAAVIAKPAVRKAVRRTKARA